LATKFFKNSSATQTQDFCEKNVLKLQDLEEVLLGNWHFVCKKNCSSRLPKYNRILKIFYYPLLPTTQIWLIPLVDDLPVWLLITKLEKRKRKRKRCLIAIFFSFLGGPIIQS
jgi:hypothetical protein